MDENPLLTLAQVKEKFERTFTGKTISATSIWRILTGAGMTFKVLERRALQVKKEMIQKYTLEYNELAPNTHQLVFLDEVSICPNQLGQKAALWGMRNLSEWLKGERLEILRRKQAIIDGFEVLSEKGWQLMGVGAYFAYVQHPFSLPSNELCKKLVDNVAVLTLPGTMFVPEEDKTGERQIRIAFANISTEDIKILFARLATVSE